jgi:hypothetical protein
MFSCSLKNASRTGLSYQLERPDKTTFETALALRDTSGRPTAYDGIYERARRDRAESQPVILERPLIGYVTFPRGTVANDTVYPNLQIHTPVFLNKESVAANYNAAPAGDIYDTYPVVLNPGHHVKAGPLYKGSIVYTTLGKDNPWITNGTWNSVATSDTRSWGDQAGSEPVLPSLSISSHLPQDEKKTWPSKIYNGFIIDPAEPTVKTGSDYASTGNANSVARLFGEGFELDASPQERLGWYD